MRFLAPRITLVSRAPGAGTPGTDGQWRRLHLAEFSGHLPGAARRASPHATVHASHERQGRALHSNRAAGVGVCPAVLHFCRSRSTARRLDRPLQLRSPTWQSRRAAPHESVPRGGTTSCSFTSSYREVTYFRGDGEPTHQHHRDSPSRWAGSAPSRLEGSPPPRPESRYGFAGTLGTVLVPELMLPRNACS